MGVVAKRSKSDFAAAPEGLWPAVCIDVVDLGMLEVTYKGKTLQQHKIKIRWAIDETDAKTGKQYWVAKRFTNSLSEKATLFKYLESWRGKKFTDEELEGFDLDNVIGANCQVSIQHNIGTDGTKYANVVAVVKKAKGAPDLMIPTDYVREKDRAHSTEESNANGDYRADDSDLPF